MYFTQSPSFQLRDDEYFNEIIIYKERKEEGNENDIMFTFIPAMFTMKMMIKTKNKGPLSLKNKGPPFLEKQRASPSL